MFLLNGVLEHLVPEEREFVLREGARLLRSGGFLAIAETPNRWFPRNSHTKLWFSEILPPPSPRGLHRSSAFGGTFPGTGALPSFEPVLGAWMCAR